MDRQQRRPERSYGKVGWITIAGRKCYTASAVERQWLKHLEAAIEGGIVIEWEWQPGPVPIAYRYAHGESTRTYQPDARVVWKTEEGEVWYEIKHGRIEQKAGNNMKQFCLQYPDRKLVMVWKGREPKKGMTKRQWDKVLPHLHHIWYMT